MTSALEITLWVSEHCNETTVVTPLGGDRYRMEHTLISELDASLGTIVRLRHIDEDEYELVEIVEHEFSSESVFIPRVFADSPALYDFGRWIEEHGGRWECVMSGLLFVHFPLGAAVAWPEELQRRLDELKTS